MKTIPEKGDIVTIKNMRTGDRSYQDALWETTAVNKTHVQLKWVGGSKPYGGMKRIMLIEEYSFEPAYLFDLG